MDTGFCHLIGQKACQLIDWARSIRFFDNFVSMESIGCFFLYPVFRFVLFPGLWLVDGHCWCTLDSVISLVKNPAIWLVGDLIVNSPNVRSSIRILYTITLRNDIQYIQSTCIHYAVFKHSWYDSVVYCYTLHFQKSQNAIDDSVTIYIVGPRT